MEFEILQEPSMSLPRLALTALPFLALAFGANPALAHAGHEAGLVAGFAATFDDAALVTLLAADLVAALLTAVLPEAAFVGATFFTMLPRDIVPAL
jgi:hypothetical protein